LGYGIDESQHAGTRHRVRRVLVGVLLLNVLVAVAKLAYGYFSASVAMVADGFHSLFDGASNLIGLVGVGLAAKPADRTHPYGHGKYETWASIGIGLLLALTAWNVAREAVFGLFEGGAGPRVDAGSFAVMLGTLAVNLGVTAYERRIGRRLGSEILIADASHTGSDVLVSLGVVGGLLAVRLGYPLADPIIALVVAGIIARTAWSVFRRAERTFSDAARIAPDRIADACVAVDGVLGCHDVRTRGSLSEVYVDMHVQVDPGLSLEAAHDIAEEVERRVCEAFEQVKDVIVHIEPLDAYQADKTVDQMGALQ
jgi:cation diffusion facilitator family transporter